MAIHKPRLKPLRLKRLSASVIIFSLILICIQLALHLHNERIIELPPYITSRLWSLSVVIATFFVISLLLRLTIKRVFNFFDAPEERIFYSKIYSWSLYSIGIFKILYQLGVSLGNITLFVGLLATGLAFAIRDVLLSFFGWIILLQKKPFRIGDYIRIGEDEGKVLHIGTFYVLLDNTPELPEDYTRVPNRLFLEKSIVKLGKTHMHEKLRLQLTSIPERDALTRAEEDITKLLNLQSKAKLFLDIQNEKIQLHISYLVPFEQREVIRHEVLYRIDQQLKPVLYLPR